jgi:hypothetical protein
MEVKRQAAAVIKVTAFRIGRAIAVAWDSQRVARIKVAFADTQEGVVDKKLGQSH